MKGGGGGNLQLKNHKVLQDLPKFQFFFGGGRGGHLQLKNLPKSTKFKFLGVGGSKNDHNKLSYYQFCLCNLQL